MNRYNYSRSDFTDEDDDHLAGYVQRCIEVSLGICLFLLILAVMQNKDLQDQIKQRESEYKEAKAETRKYSGLLAECMNGGAAFDKASDTAYFCDRPSEVRL